MSRVLYWYYSAKYALFAWIDHQTRWHWANEEAWDAVEWKAHYSGALDRLLADLEAEIKRTPSSGQRPNDLEAE